MKVFSKYNFEIYNAIYNSKDYNNEVDVLIDIFKGKGLPDSKSIIDLGCGTGNFTIRLIDKGYNVEGIDFSESFVDYVKKNKLFKIEKANILNFNSDKKFDIAISMFHVVSYFKSLIQLENFIVNCKTLLNKNGLFGNLLSNFSHPYTTVLKSLAFK